MTDWILKKLDHLKTPQKAVELWNGNINSLKLINDGINVVYRFESNGEGKYLRITHPNIRSLKKLNASIDYQKHLFLQGAPVCHPIKSKKENYVEKIKQKSMTFYAHVSNEVSGKTIDIKQNDIAAHHAWGKALAQLHCATVSYQPNKNYHFMTWQDLWKEIHVDIKKENKIIQKAYFEVDEFLKTAEKTLENFGLTHGDHRGANALYDGNQVHIIDFDEPVYHWLVADIACAFLCPYTIDIWCDKFLAFIKGYKSIRNLSKNDINNITWFMRMKNLSLYTWTKNNWHHSQVPGGGKRDEWLKNVYRLIVEPVDSSRIIGI